MNKIQIPQLQTNKELFYKGNLELLKLPKVAIIGSRRMSVYTKNCVIKLASMLKNSGVCVVSGGALGVDICASEAAMPMTIGIFANGLDEIYPKTNEKTIRKIYEKALALSAYEPNYKPKKYDFLLRNRLIVALSQKVVVAQADLNSGSFQSAKFALKMNKPVYVLPQRIGESEGTNLLLEQKKVSLLNDFENFVSFFKTISYDQSDEILKFCANNPSLDDALKKFGDKIYEYELDGKIAIEGLFVRVLM